MASARRYDEAVAAAGEAVRLHVFGPFDSYADVGDHAAHAGMVPTSA